MPEKTISFIVDGGKANAGPPIGSTLGPLGLAVMDVVNHINEKTKEFSGMRVPVKVHVDTETKEFSIDVGIPTTSALVVKELKIEKGSATPNANKVGNLTIPQVLKIAKIKQPSTLADSPKAAAKEVLGSCVSLGVTVEGKDPREIQREIDAGKWDTQLSE